MSKRIEKRNIKWSVEPSVKTSLEKLAFKSKMGFNEYGATLLTRAAMEGISYAKPAPVQRKTTRKQP